MWQPASLHVVAALRVCLLLFFKAFVCVYVHADGFRKVMHIDTGIVKQERDGPVEFQHPYFKQGQDDLLENIKRKVQHLSVIVFVLFLTRINTLTIKVFGLYLVSFSYFGSCHTLYILCRMSYNK